MTRTPSGRLADAVRRRSAAGERAGEIPRKDFPGSPASAVLTRNLAAQHRQTRISNRASGGSKRPRSLGAGRRPDLGISEAVLLASALKVPVVDLFAGGGTVEVGDTTMRLADLRDRPSARPSARRAEALDARSYSATERGWARRLGLLPDEVRAATDRYWGETADGKVAEIMVRFYNEGRRDDIATLEEAEREAFAELDQLLTADWSRWIRSLRTCRALTQASDDNARQTSEG